MFMLLFCSFFLVLVVCFSNKTNRFVQKCQQSRQLHNNNNNNNNNENIVIIILITINTNTNKDVSNSAIERLRGDD